MEQYITAIATIFSTVLATVFAVTAKMNSINKEIQKMSERILEKLEYHERHDDERFNAVRNELEAVRLRNAAKDVVMQEIMDDIKKLTHGYLNDKKSLFRDPKD